MSLKASEPDKQSPKACFPLKKATLFLEITMALHLPLVVVIAVIHALLWAKLIALLLLSLNFARGYRVRKTLSGVTQLVIDGRQIELFFANGSAASFSTESLYISRIFIVWQFEHRRGLLNGLCLMPVNFCSSDDFRRCYIACRQTHF
ncbi:hypothetical protein P886_2864 [Alteromonadaceae bacterium 2753L.S.0a.02]|nr:hypothetical protein P886_2864 [Alteromonadaceae bacterium 2753L.S.0a.02]